MGVDIGGTKTACGRVRADGGRLSIEQSVMVPTFPEPNFEVSLRQVFAAIDQCWSGAVRAIGISAPGPLNPHAGMMLNPPNMPGWRDVSLARMAAERYDVPCVIENDANAAGLAEWRMGAARGCGIVLYLTISTGIGAGLIVDGKIFQGRHGLGAEAGHVSIDYRYPEPCKCGSRGCIEQLASGAALRRRGLRAEALSEDQLDEIALMLGAWLGSLVSLFDPDIIVVGGGMSNIGDPLFARLRRIVPLRTINPFAEEIPIVPAELGPEVGIYGGAAVALSHSDL
ncbi:MAG: ROK family protein [Acidobacteria bacterium]|nr:ROK family protein [Acidobacteriota bacterium]